MEKEKYALQQSSSSLGSIYMNVNKPDSKLVFEIYFNLFYKENLTRTLKKTVQFKKSEKTCYITKTDK